MWIRRPQGMNLLFVSSEGIQIKECLWAGRTGQLRTQVGPVHMGADGHMRSGWSFTAPLNLAPMNPLDAPTFRQRHVMSAGMVTSRAWGMAKQGASCAYVPPSATGMKDSGSALLGSQKGCFDTVVVGVTWHLLTRGGTIGMAEWDRAPHKSLYRPSASKTAKE